MHIYADYIAPITVWLHQNPHFALAFTFIISLLESLAIVGTIIPGSLTMTAVGILAGSNVMRLDLTLLFATFGAVIGDGLSYLLGAVYSERLSTFWPFSRYPTVLRYGQEFFDRHGSKSVLIGRFTGPLRSITPIIAGMMHMPRWQFFSANLISAIAWSILYIIPGYIIGAASHQLSAESAQRLFGFVMGILITLWLASLLIKYLAQTLNQWFTVHIDKLWRWSSKNKTARYLIKKMIHKKDPEPQKVLSLSIHCLTCIVSTLLLGMLVSQENWLKMINEPITYFLQTLRTPYFDKILIFASCIFNPLSLIILIIFIAMFACMKRDWRFLKYWLSVFACTSLLTFMSAQYFFIQPAIHLFSEPSPALFPSVYLCIATALLVFLINYLLNKKMSLLISITIGSYALCLVISGVATLYLGDNWLSSVLGAYGMGISVGLLHWIFYRRKTIPTYNLTIPIVCIYGLLIATSLFSAHYHFTDIQSHHTVKPKQYTLNQDTWWYQYDEPILPIYSTNRVGRRMGVFNVQYAGSIEELEKRLETCGWKNQPKSFLYSLIIHAEGRYTSEELPFMEPLYLNNNPALTMSYRTVKNDNLYILRLWRSNYHLMHYEEPIWLGKIILARKKSHSQTSFTQPPKAESLFVHILPAVHDYQIARIDTADPHLKSLPYEIPSELLIIKN